MVWLFTVYGIWRSYNKQLQKTNNELIYITTYQMHTISSEQINPKFQTSQLLNQILLRHSPTIDSLVHCLSTFTNILHK